MGANFVLQKPITTLNASRCFHAALNFMLKERRRYFRQPVTIPVAVMVEGKVVKATSTNISEGGMALLLPQALPKGATPRLKFCLPHTDTSIEVEAEVAWADVKGLAGLRFHQVAKEIQQQLERWLDARIEEEFPGTKDRISTAGERASDGSGFQPPPQRGN
jgi:c-di-GMP-binding flagellar brake protein YcgR